MQLALDLLVSALLSHVQRNGPALLFYHGEVLQVFVRVKEKLASVELDEDAGHGPKVTLFVPGLVL